MQHVRRDHDPVRAAQAQPVLVAEDDQAKEGKILVKQYLVQMLGVIAGATIAVISLLITADPLPGLTGGLVLVGFCVGASAWPHTYRKEPKSVPRGTDTDAT